MSTQTSLSDHGSDNPEKVGWGENIRTVIIAMILAMGFRCLAFEPFHIPSGSMKNTLLIGDYLFVSKYSYGYSRYSFPFGLPIFSGRVAEINEPKRGDIVVFRYPHDTRIDFIKRLIGLPGDRIRLKDGIVYINGEPLKRQQLNDYADDENKHDIKSIPSFAETLPEGKVINILKQQKVGQVDNTQEYVVPPKHYFMMGDNRDNSHDSRYLEDVGYIPEENLIGRAEIIFFSTDGTASLTDPVSWFRAIRIERFFKMIE